MLDNGYASAAFPLAGTDERNFLHEVACSLRQRRVTNRVVRERLDRIAETLEQTAGEQGDAGLSLSR